MGNLPHLEATETQLTKEERNFAFRAFSILRVFLLDNRDKFQDEFSLVKRNKMEARTREVRRFVEFGRKIVGVGRNFRFESKN